MKRFSAPPGVYADPSRPPDDGDESDASSNLSDGSKKVKTAQSFESLFNSESLSDIILDINQGEYVFHAHKMIIGLKSERLAALITSVASMPSDNSGKPVLYLQEPVDCSAVFSRFLYFIYSGAVWLHRDYVVPLFQLSIKYGVSALATHCENYIQQILNKMLIQDPSSPLTQSLTINSVGDLYEEPGYRDETKKIAFQVLCKRFTDFARTERWVSATWLTVRDLLRSDECICEENLILVSATDWMKRNKLQDKARIQEILSAIRYPRLPRRVLYHLHATSSFKKFPPVQDLIDAAIHYHCFRDVPEAQSQFTGLQYRARGCGSRNNNNNNNNNNTDHHRHHMCGDMMSENDAMCIAGADDDEDNTLEHTVEDNNNHQLRQHQYNTYASCQMNTSPSCRSLRNDSVSNCCCHHQHQHQHPHPQSNQHQKHNHDTHDSLNISPTTTTTGSTTAPTLPLRHRSRSEDRHTNISPQRDHRLAAGNGPGGTMSRSTSQQSRAVGSLSHSHRAARPQGAIFESVSTFHSPFSPVATVQPRVQGQRDSSQDFIDDNDNDGDDEGGDGVSIPPPPPPPAATLPPPISPGNDNSSTGNNNNNSNNQNFINNNSMTVISHSHSLTQPRGGLG